MRVTVELNKMELQVIRMIADGKGAKEIALEMGLSKSWIKQVTQILYLKCGIYPIGYVGLVRFAIRNGIVKA